VRSLRIAIALCLALALPVTLRSSSATPIGVELVANDAECQTKTSCEPIQFRICPHMDGNDYMDYKCISGCRVDDQ
jgi:hypothetical protein